MRFNFSLLLLAIALIGLVHSSPVKRQAEDEQTVGEQVGEAVNSAIDSAQEAQAHVEDKAVEVQEAVEKKVDEVKSEAVEAKQAVEKKVAEVQDKAAEAHNDLEESKDSMLESAEQKLNELSEDAKEVHEDLKKKVDEAHADLKETAEEAHKNLKAHAVEAHENAKNQLDALHEAFSKEYVEVEVKCSADEDCGHGRCSNLTCACDPGFVSFGNGTCSYEQKTKMSTFFLSLFFGPFGADWFHLARDNSNYCWTGGFKLLTGLVTVFGGCFLCCVQFFFAAMDGHKIGAGLRVVLLAVVSVLSLINVIWYFVDLGRILFDSFPDGNHVPLTPW